MLYRPYYHPYFYPACHFSELTTKLSGSVMFIVTTTRKPKQFQFIHKDVLQLCNQITSQTHNGVCFCKPAGRADMTCWCLAVLDNFNTSFKTSLCFWKSLALNVIMDTVTHVSELQSSRKRHPRTCLTFHFPRWFSMDFFLLCRGTLWNDCAFQCTFSKWSINLLNLLIDNLFIHDDDEGTNMHLSVKT